MPLRWKLSSYLLLIISILGIVYFSVENLKAPTKIYNVEANTNIQSSSSGREENQLVIKTSTQTTIDISGTTVSPVKPKVTQCLPKADIYIFMYHYIRDVIDIDAASTRELSVSPKIFKAQMQSIDILRSKDNLATVSIGELRKMLDTRCFPNKNIFVFTADDGWTDSFTNLAPIAGEFGIPFSFGIISSKIDTKGFVSSEQVRILAGHPLFSIVSHSVNHTDQSKITPENEKKEFCGSKEKLEKLTGKTISTYIYPSGRFTQNSIKIAKECGYTLAFSTNFGTGIETSKEYLDINRIRVDHERKADFFENLLKKSK